MCRLPRPSNRRLCADDLHSFLLKEFNEVSQRDGRIPKLGAESTAKHQILC
jgi:hypothetical protein